ncbi:MAG TPA: PPC domain-containing protein, partial [Aggregatilineales bacterium]|nr:PPC domain-containing protein [Aggregatilineales bacterium]
RYPEYAQEILSNVVNNVRVDDRPIARDDVAPLAPRQDDLTLVLDVPREDFLSAREIREWRFSASAGDVLRIRMDAVDDVDPVITLLDANRNALAENDDGGENANSLLRFEVPASGDYIIQAKYFSFTDEGRYLIEVETYTTRSIEGGELFSGGTVRGQITDAAPEVRYTFNAQAGNILTLTMASLFGDLDTYLTVISPGGTILAENDDYDSSQATLFFASDSAITGITLSESGIYTVLAQRYQGQLGDSNGEYELMLMLQ